MSDHLEDLDYTYSLYTVDLEPTKFHLIRVVNDFPTHILRNTGEWLPLPVTDDEDEMWAFMEAVEPPVWDMQ